MLLLSTGYLPSPICDAPGPPQPAKLRNPCEPRRHLPPDQPRLRPLPDRPPRPGQRRSLSTQTDRFSLTPKGSAMIAVGGSPRCQAQLERSPVGASEIPGRSGTHGEARSTLRGSIRNSLPAGGFRPRPSSVRPFGPEKTVTLSKYVHGAGSMAPDTRRQCRRSVGLGQCRIADFRMADQ